MNNKPAQQYRNYTSSWWRLLPAAGMAAVFLPNILSAQLEWVNSYYIAPLPGEVNLFQESFETNGEGTRYKTQNPSDDAGSDFFARRQIGSTGVRSRGGAQDGDWVWAGRDIDGDGVSVDDLVDFEARIWMQPFSITGYRNLRIIVAVGQGENSLDFDDRLTVQYRIDGTDDWATLSVGSPDVGSWTKPGTEDEWVVVGGFRGKFTNSPGWYFEGDDFTYPPANTPRLTQAFREFSWMVWGIGDTMQVRVFEKMNGATEEYSFDNLRVVGVPDLGSINPALNKTIFTETEGAAAGQLTININPPAPAGGLTVNLYPTDSKGEHVILPETVTIAEGASTITVPFDVLHDERFGGLMQWRIQMDAEGYGRNEVTYQIINVDPRPRLLITEIYPIVASTGFDSLGNFVRMGDANGDAYRHAEEDEFVEFMNLDTKPIDMSGWYLIDDLGPRHVFPDGTILQPGQVLVVFTAGIPTGKFGGAMVQVSSSGRLALSDEGGPFSLVASGSVVREIVFAGTLAATQKSILIPQNLIAESGFEVDEGALTGSGQPGDKYIIARTDQGIDAGTLPNPDLPLFFFPGMRKDGSGLPLMDWTNEIDVEIASATAIPAEDWPFQPRPFATIAVREGDTATLTIRLAQAPPAEGIVVSLDVIDAVAAISRPASSLELSEIRSIDRAGKKVVLEYNEILLSSTDPVTVDLQTHNLAGQPDGDMVARITARADGVLFGYVDLLIVDTDFDPANGIIINEAMSGVGGSDSDPNLNGVKEENPEDQYIEIVNTGQATVNLGGWRLYAWGAGNKTGEELVHIFPEGTYLNPLGAILVFGGGDEVAMNAASGTAFGGAQVQVANVGMNGVNLVAGEHLFIRIENLYGKVADLVWISSTLTSQTQAVTRYPDLTGPWTDRSIAEQATWPKLHFTLEEAALAKFSAGKQINGTPFPGNSLPLTPVTSVYGKASAFDMAGYTFSTELGILYTKEWPWSYHYDLERWVLPVSGGPNGDGDDAGSLFLFDADNGGWLFTDLDNYPMYYNYSASAWLSFE